jgi:acyltransferase
MPILGQPPSFSQTTLGTTHKRIRSIDFARFYGMILVYYGHIVEQVMYAGSAEAAAQYKFIYSFHMPLFFFLSGTIVAEKKLALPLLQYCKQILASRLVPYIFFSILTAIVSLAIPGWFPLGALNDAGGYLKSAIATLIGFPAFCIPLWFMALLISVELFHALISRVTQRLSILVVLAVILYVCGYYLNQLYNFVENQQAFWFINEVPVIYLFYVAGVLLQKSGFLHRDFPRRWTLPGALLCFLLVALTFDLNQGPFRIIQAVVIVLSGHGNIVLFPLTAFLGSFFILFAAVGTPAAGWISYLGQNALSLFCLNGLFYHFVNPVTATWFAKACTTSHATVFLYSTLMTVLSLAVCLPLIFLLTRYVPQLMGKPMHEGPLLRPLIKK